MIPRVITREASLITQAQVDGSDTNAHIAQVDFVCPKECDQLIIKHVAVRGEVLPPRTHITVETPQRRSQASTAFALGTITPKHQAADAKVIVGRKRSRATALCSAHLKCDVYSFPRVGTLTIKAEAEDGAAPCDLQITAVAMMSDEAEVSRGPAFYLREKWASAPRKCWEPNPTDGSRFDFPGTSGINELIKNTKHSCIDQKTYGFVRHFVYPLHNTFQKTAKLDNEDEVQVMIVPKRKEEKTSKAFLATNSDRVTQEILDEALANNFNGMKQFAIESLTVVTGQPGRHAEQKLLEYLDSHKAELGIHSGQKARILGERFPCAACRVFAMNYETIATLLPSHGHMYLSTVATTPQLADRDPVEVHRCLSRGGRVLQVTE